MVEIDQAEVTVGTTVDVSRFQIKVSHTQCDAASDRSDNLLSVVDGSAQAKQRTGKGY